MLHLFHCGSHWFKKKQWRLIKLSCSSHYFVFPPHSPINLTYDVFDGKGESTPLVFLHGLFGSKSNFHSIAKSLVQRTGRKVMQWWRRHYCCFLYFKFSFRKEKHAMSRCKCHRSTLVLIFLAADKLFLFPSWCLLPSVLTVLCPVRCWQSMPVTMVPALIALQCPMKRWLGIWSSSSLSCALRSVFSLATVWEGKQLWQPLSHR